MFGSLGFPELLFILLLALLIFGPRRLPEVGRTIGRALGEFRRATHDLKRSIDTEISLEDAAKPPSAPVGGAPRSAPAKPVEEAAVEDADAERQTADEAAAAPDAGGSPTGRRPSS